MTDPETERLRAEIAAQDRAILTAVNERLRLVAKLKRHKERTGTAFVDPEQEERLLQQLEDANAGPLSRAGVRQFFRALLALTKNEVD